MAISLSRPKYLDPGGYSLYVGGELLAAAARRSGMRRPLVGDTGCGRDLLDAANMRTHSKYSYKIDAISLNTANGEVTVEDAVNVFFP